MDSSVGIIGNFSLNKKLKLAHKKYLKNFSLTRRVLRDTNIANAMKDSIRIDVGLPIGEDACYFVGATELNGEKDKSIIDYTKLPSNQPSSWCQWMPSDDGNSIIWDAEQEFTYPVDWARYLINNFIGPWGYKLNGSVKWLGYEKDDIGIININNNKIEIVNLSVFS